MTDTTNTAAHTVGNEANDGRGRRHWKNFFFKPGFKFKYTWYFVAGGLGIFGITTGLIQHRLGEVTAMTNARPILSLSEQAYVQELFVEITKISLVGFSSYVLFSFLLAFIVSHRVSGPMVALTDIIRQFKDGNFGYRRPLRRRDELKQIHGELMDLGEALQEREASKADKDKSAGTDGSSNLSVVEGRS